MALLGGLTAAAGLWSHSRLEELPALADSTWQPLPVREELPEETTVERAPTGDGTTLTISPLPSGGAHSLQEIYRENIASIVSIRGSKGDGMSLGTGVVMSEDGYIITNSHVIEGCGAVDVVLQDERVFQALLVGQDAQSDLAVLKIACAGLTPAQFGDSTLLEVGDAVAANGNPLGEELRGTMTELFAASLRRGEGGAPTVEEVRRKNLALQQERAELLARMDLAEDALDDKPACPLCGDTGWRGTEMCRCLRALCAQEQIRELSKLLDLGEQSFDTFRMDYYSTSFWPEWGTSPRENMELVYEVCLNYAQKFGRFYFKNLFLSGAPGLGKTFLSACIARTVSENGHSVVYDTAGNVFAQFEARKFLRDSDDGREARDETRRYLGCDLLILDDLGSELTTQFTQSALYELINGRLVGGKRTVISSNLSMEEAAVRYSPQIASRLEGEYHLLHFFGEDIRLLRKKQL